MERAQVVRVHETGGPEQLVYEEVELGEPGRGEVRLRQEAVGLNYIDTYHRSGLYPQATPVALGMEASGVVEAVGEAVEAFEVGDRVAYGAGPPGSYADRRVMPADRLVALPEAIDHKTAAAGMLKGMTAEYLVRRTYEVTDETTVLWHAAAGGVGRLAVQWLDELGATVYGTVSTDEKAVVAKGSGCDEVIRYTDESVVERVRELTDGRGVDVVYDGVGRSTFAGSLDSLARRGMLVAFGNASGPPPAIEPLELSRRGSLFLTRPSLMDYVATREELVESAGALFEVITGGGVEVEVGQIWSLEEAAEAHRALENRETVGSSVLVP